MANIMKSNSSFLDAVLPTYGNPRCNLPVWNEEDKMYISDEYEVAGGNFYFKGLRFSNRLAIVEKVGLFHNWRYIDEVEVYTFDRETKTLIGSAKFDKIFYNHAVIEAKVKEIVSNYLLLTMKLQNLLATKESIANDVDKLVAETYVNLLSEDYKINLRQLLPVLQPEC